MPSLLRSAVVALAIAALSTAVWSNSVHAHDFWLGVEPIDEGRQALRLWVGHQLDVEEELGFESSRIVSATLVGNGQRVDVRALGREGDTPLFTLPAGGGAVLFGLERRRVAAHTMERPKFDAYLRDEGLGDMRGVLQSAPVRDGEVERYSRYLKVRRGSATAQPAASELLGYRFEIVLPDGLGADGEATRVCLRFDAAPLPGRMITLLSGDAPSSGARHRRSRVSASDGCAELFLPRAGFHLLRSVHLRPCRDDCGPAHWESFWAAYSIQQ